MTRKKRCTRIKSIQLRAIRNLKIKERKSDTSNPITSSLTSADEIFPEGTNVTYAADVENSSNENSFLVEKEPSKLDSTENELMTGRCIIDVLYFFKRIQELNDHSPFSCNISHMKVTAVKHDGLISVFTLKCSMCSIENTLATEDASDTTQMNLNSATVLAAVSTGMGHSAVNEIHAIQNMPSLSYRQYAKHHDIVSDVIFKSAWASMAEAGKEEARLAREVGDVGADGIPVITVIADGAWSKRSYKVNYNASSGVGCIVGAKTGKLLFVGVRNKYCPMCDKANSNKESPKTHKCFKNWSGSSTSMESDIILEGFRQSVEMHGLKYTKLVGDGDSSVFKTICIHKPYGPTVSIRKIECTNHLLRNYCAKLGDISKRRYSSKQKFVSPALRKALQSNMLRLRVGIKKAVEYRRTQAISAEEQLSLLVRDIKNCPSHVFGKHDACEPYFCTGPKEQEINLVDQMKECGLLDDIIICGNRGKSASPDGIIDKDTILEIKYPWSISDLTPQAAVEQNKIPYLIFQNGKVQLKKSHNYYYQVQGQMEITGSQFCYFVIWTPHGIIVDKVEKDIHFWEEILPKLKKFYLETMLPEIVKNSK